MQSFAAQVTNATGSDPESVAVGDFNGDGYPDLVVANYNATTVSVFLGTAAGTFGTATTYTVGSNPYSVAVGDFNGDGKPDLAVVNSGSNNISELLNTSTGGTLSFAAQTPLAAGTNPYAVAVGDGSTLSSTQLDASATGAGGVSVPGTFVYSPAAGTTPAAGSDTLSVTFTPTDTTDYNTATATVTLTVAGFSLTENNGVSSQQVTAGGAATFNLTVSPVGSTTLLTPVALSITGLPPDATATFTPATVAAGSAATAVKLVIQTTGSSAVRNTKPQDQAPRNVRPILLMLLVLPLVAMQLLRKRMQRAPRFAAAVLFAALSMGAVVGLSGCSAAVSTPPHTNTTYNLVVTETSGAVSHNFNLTLIVQR